MKEIIKNIAAEPPANWKKIRNIALTIGSIGGAILGAPLVFPAIVLPAALVQVASWAAVIGLAAGATAQAPTKKKE